MKLLIYIAIRHLLARKRQSIVSLLGIILGVAFFLAISSLMQGSENDFINRLVNNAPHILISDEYRNPRKQPVEKIYPNGAIEINSVKPITETRGIRGYGQIIEYLRSMQDVQAAPVLSGQGVVSFAGKDMAISIDGMFPEDIKDVTTIQDYMVSGSMNDLITNSDGIVIGKEMARILSLEKGDNITVTSPTGQVRVFKILGLFRTGRSGYDKSHGFVSLKRMQTLLDRPNRINSIIVKIPNPYEAQIVADDIESRIGYKSVSWQETSEDILSTLVIRNIIMYTVVSAVLIVAAFGIYNVISTVVLEKQRDIAILKSMGFRANDVKKIFIFQGIALGIIGCMVGIPTGNIFMYSLMQVSFKAPGATEVTQMPIDWGWEQFAIAIAFAMSASVVAALLPARKAATVQPVDILRGS
ncbi:MAG: ABC transporter permease [Rickettsiales bacterium]|jgi:lipoprotein-releasing system permease protein